SAGNGPAMRSALLGVCLGHDPPRLRAFVRASTRLTHTDPRAERGALLVALAAHHGASAGPAVSATGFLRPARKEVPDLDGELAGAIPPGWLDGLLEWPRSVRWMRALAARLAGQFPGHGPGRHRGALPLFWPGLLPRNLLFLLLVLGHAFRRALPPY